MRLWYGVLLATIGVATAARSALLLLGRGRPRRGPQPSFVIAGPYRRSRNPLFAGCVLAMAGMAIAIASLPLGLAAGGVALALDAWVRRIEEPRLRSRFGAAYAAYLLSVPRWVPRASRRG